MTLSCETGYSFAHRLYRHLFLWDTLTILGPVGACREREKERVAQRATHTEREKEREKERVAQNESSRQRAREQERDSQY